MQKEKKTEELWAIDFEVVDFLTGKSQPGIVYVPAKDVKEARKKAYRKIRRWYPEGDQQINLKKAEKVTGAVIL
jgi:hypothetical protein